MAKFEGLIEKINNKEKVALCVFCYQRLPILINENTILYNYIQK